MTMLTIDVITEVIEVACRECGQVKPYTAKYFAKSSGNALNLRDLCRECYNRGTRERYHRDKLPSRPPTAGTKAILVAPCYKCGGTLKKGEAGLCRKCLKTWGCSECDYREQCRERVRWGVWMICENPDKADFLRLQSSGIETKILDKIETRYVEAKNGN